jgi:phosphoglycerate-specific signal transduction histidine kinase
MQKFDSFIKSITENVSVDDMQHNIGNPVFAIETLLDPIRKRIRENRTEEALELLNSIQNSLNRIKSFIHSSNQ